MIDLTKIWVSFCVATVFCISFHAAAESPGPVKQAAEAARQGDFASVREITRTCLRTSPKSVELWNLLGIAETELGNLRDAKAAFERGLGLAPDSVSLNENAGFLYFREGDYKTARRLLERAVKLGSTNPGVRFSLDAAKLRTGDAGQALIGLRALEPQLAGNAAYWEERGRAETVSDPGGAKNSFAEALKLDPKSSIAWNGLAAIAEQSGEDEKALATLIEARTAIPDDIPTLEHFGAVCIRRDLGPDAIDALTKARRLAPGDNAVLYLLARANISVQNWQAALDLFREFSERVPRFGPAWYAIGWLEIRLNRPGEARRAIERSLTLDGAQTDAQFELAKLDLADGRMDNAEREIAAVLKQDPAHAEANVAQGDILLRRGQLDEARACYERAISAKPDLAAAHYKFAAVLTRLHDSAGADRERNAAAKLNAEAAAANKTQLRLVLPDNLSTGPLH